YQRPAYFILNHLRNCLGVFGPDRVDNQDFVRIFFFRISARFRLGSADTTQWAKKVNEKDQKLTCPKKKSTSNWPEWAADLAKGLTGIIWWKQRLFLKN